MSPKNAAVHTGMWVNKYRISITFLGFVLLAMLLIATNVRQYTIDQNQNDDITQIVTRIEKTPCGKDPTSRACRVYFNNTVKSALSFPTACYIVGKSKDPFFSYSNCVTSPSAKPEAGVTAAPPAANGEGRGTEGTAPSSPGETSSDPAPDQPASPSVPPSPEPTSPAPQEPTPQPAPQSQSSVIDTIRGTACPVTGSLGLNGVVSPVLGC